MKILLTLLFTISFLFGKYTISYKGITLGEIENFTTVEENYLKAKVTNSIAKFFLRKDFFVFYNEDYQGNKEDNNTKYKKDNYAIIYLLQKALKHDVKTEKIEVKKNKIITINYDKNYNFIYNSKGKIKSKGSLEMLNGDFIKLTETVNGIKIYKKN